MKRYPRKMTGYSTTAASARWPGRAQIALQAVLKCGECGEGNILRSAPAFEAAQEGPSAAGRNTEFSEACRQVDRTAELHLQERLGL